jgi:hypothetical protein
MERQFESQKDPSRLGALASWQGYRVWSTRRSEACKLLTPVAVGASGLSGWPRHKRCIGDADSRSYRKAYTWFLALDVTRVVAPSDIAAYDDIALLSA